MNLDLCLKPFISYDFANDPDDPNGPVITEYGLENSCWIDSLFVALFHSKNRLILEFVDNLKVKDSELDNINVIGKEIIKEIKIYI